MMDQDPYTSHLRQRIEKYFKGRLVAVYTGATAIPLTTEGFAESFVGYVHEVDLFDIVIRHIGEDEKDRFSLIPISVIKNISELGSIAQAEKHVRDHKTKEKAAAAATAS